MNDSNNTSNTYNTTTTTLSTQTLDATVTGTTVTFEGDAGGYATGAISYDGGSFASFAGIQTSGTNSGVGSLNQAATALSANANISFGSAP